MLKGLLKDMRFLDTRMGGIPCSENLIKVVCA